ncbi:MalY/PatB family protein [Thiomicrospira pelophila]|uniref:MalY/PatB family protein n=1 Tax=Thiomicrospira pelophila TaxID=934 RepID=UPI0004A6B732|nr:PatB family C-S lyase [Thiomicrospira pelophila]
MTVNFNHSISRLGTQAEKYESRQAVFGRDDVLPMWVADMDLPTPPFIIEALKQRLNHPILGYTQMPDSMFQAIVDWQSQHGYSIQAEQILLTHNVANGLFLAVQAFTRPGDAVLIQPPIYPPFYQAAQLNDRQLALAPLVLVQNQYQIDFVEFERQIKSQSVRLFLLCNPHNPAGRVWSGSELRQMAEICLKHDVIMVSDEIHSDLVYDGYHHTPLASISEEVAQRTVTLSSPGKTFNLAGLQIGYAIIANPTLREAFAQTLARAKIDDLNLFGMIALEAAYSSEGRVWRRDLMTHFQTNIECLQLFLAEHFPQVKLIRPQASYLVWLDFRGLFSDHQVLKNWLINEAKLGLNDGESYGEMGSGFMRMNIAAPKSTLEQAFRQLVQAKSGLKTL